MTHILDRMIKGASWAIVAEAHTPMNARGLASVDQVRARISREQGRAINGKEVAERMSNIYGAPSQGYHTIRS